MESVVSYPDRGEGGKSSYRGNCSPRLIEDIIDQWKIKELSDFMVGSGTTEDVVNAKGITGKFADLNRGYDMMTMDIPERSQNIFWHPPYDDIIVYSDKQYKASDVINKYGLDPRINDLSRCNGWDNFVKKMNYCMCKQFASLEKGGRMFVLMGDIKKKGKLYSMLCDIAKPGTLEQIVIKMQHNCVSDGRSYNGRFVPIVHEYLMVVRKDTATIFNISLSKSVTFDIRVSKGATWRDLIASIIEDANTSAVTRDYIYKCVEKSPKIANNNHWKEKVRQVLNTNKEFIPVGNGCYKVISVA